VADAVRDDGTIRDSRQREHRWTEIQRRLEAASDALSRQGSVTWRTTPAGTRVASVRFVGVVDGNRRHRAVYLGRDSELIRRARELIATCRERERWAREVEEAARFVRASNILIRRTIATRRRGTARRGGGERGEGPLIDYLRVEQESDSGR
jgi:hypothetical protein